MRQVICKEGEFQKKHGMQRRTNPFPKTEQELRATYDRFVNPPTGNLKSDDGFYTI